MSKLPILGSFSAFVDSFPHPSNAKTRKRLVHLSAKNLGLIGGHLVTFGMALQAQRDSGESWMKGGLRLERL